MNSLVMSVSLLQGDLSAASQVKDSNTKVNTSISTSQIFFNNLNLIRKIV